MKSDRGLLIVLLASYASMVAFVIIGNSAEVIVSAAKSGINQEWLGFAGNILGSLVTLFAAMLAWLAVRAQIHEQRRSVESQRRDVANHKLTDHIVAVFNCFTSYERLRNCSEEERSAQFRIFSDETSSSPMLAALVDPLMGADTSMVALFITSMRSSAARISGLNPKADHDGRYELLAGLLYHELTTTIPQRRTIMMEKSVDDLSNLSLINPQTYHAIRLTGEVA